MTIEQKVEISVRGGLFAYTVLPVLDRVLQCNSEDRIAHAQ